MPLFFLHHLYSSRLSFVLIRMAYVGSIVPPSSFANDYYTVPVTGTWGEVDRCYPPLDTGQEAYLTKQNYMLSANKLMRVQSAISYP